MGLAWAAGGAGGSETDDRLGPTASKREVVVYSEEDEAMVAERLRALGYLE
jgi:hypothetical protein